jgi:hypothetical protein
MARTKKAARAVTVATAAPDDVTAIMPPAGEANGEHMGRSMSLRDTIDVTEGQHGMKPAADTANGAAAHERKPPAQEAASDQPAYAADPHEKITVSLSHVKGGPAVHLLRSHRFRQMQIQFDREQPGEKYLKMLKDAGWTDRTESEGVFTKQIDPNARWQSVQKMEREFRDIANAIREGKGMGPVLDGLGA